MDLKPYQFEISKITNELKDMERGIFYEENNSRGTASARNIAKHVRELFEDLMVRMAEEKPGRLQAIFKRDTENNEEFKEEIEKLKNKKV